MPKTAWTSHGLGGFMSQRDSERLVIEIQLTPSVIRVFFCFCRIISHSHRDYGKMLGE